MRNLKKTEDPNKYGRSASSRVKCAEFKRLSECFFRSLPKDVAPVVIDLNPGNGYYADDGLYTKFGGNQSFILSMAQQAALHRPNTLIVGIEHQELVCRLLRFYLSQVKAQVHVNQANTCSFFTDNPDYVKKLQDHSDHVVVLVDPWSTGEDEFDIIYRDIADKFAKVDVMAHLNNGRVSRVVGRWKEKPSIRTSSLNLMKLNTNCLIGHPLGHVTSSIWKAYKQRATKSMTWLVSTRNPEFRREVLESDKLCAEYEYVKL